MDLFQKNVFFTKTVQGEDKAKQWKKLTEK